MKTFSIDDGTRGGARGDVRCDPDAGVARRSDIIS